MHQKQHGKAAMSPAIDPNHQQHQLPSLEHTVPHPYEDGLPEAAEAVDGPWFVAVQWHPELMGVVPGGQDLFDALVRESAA